MDVHELGEWVKLLGSILVPSSLLVAAFVGLVLFTAKFHRLTKNLAKCIESVSDHEGRLVKHSFRLGVIEQKVGIIPVEVE